MGSVLAGFIIGLEFKEFKELGILYVSTAFPVRFQPDIILTASYGQCLVT